MIISVSVGLRMGLLPFTGKQRHHIHHPFSRIDVSLVAGGYEGVDYDGTICSIVIVSVAIVVQTDLKQPYDLLDTFNTPFMQMRF